MKDLESCFKGIEINLSPGQKDLLSIFIKELTAWNRHMNLTGLSSTRRIMDELVADSLMPLPYLPDTGICLDVGSGAGFPAIPLKICRPAMKFFLMEPNLKKGSFLKQIIRLCGLKQIEVIRERIEMLSQPLPFEWCHIITSRAMAPLPRLVKLCAPYLAPGGLMVAFLGNRFEDILAECKPLLKEKGLFVHDSKPYILKGKELKRNLLVLKKRK
ncbi:MAG: 16S rRNA (guanine(527)-N(7))-methyltransferase RsmG [Deltaproteobacteria bacterium]|nr:16S rRNA (guanine(527)-N(7))-methyltransferase RsmG [Deltaproteobacteria bacterium]